VKKLYVSCSLTGRPDQYRADMIALRQTLARHFEILEFCDADVPPNQIFEHDIDYCVRVADFILAIADFPSTGLGYEVGTMVEKYGKPVLAVAHRDSVVSVIVTGITRQNFQFLRYDDISEIQSMMIEFSTRKFVPLERVQYVVVSTSSQFDEKLPTIPRVTSSDPVTALRIAREMIYAGWMSPYYRRHVAIYRIIEGQIFNCRDFSDKTMNSLIVYSARTPHFDSNPVEAFGPGFKEVSGG